MSNGRELLPGLSSGQLQELQEPQEPVTEPVLPAVPVLTVPSVPTATLINTTRQRIDQARHCKLNTITCHPIWMKGSSRESPKRGRNADGRREHEDRSAAERVRLVLCPGFAAGWPSCLFSGMGEWLGGSMT